MLVFYLIDFVFLLRPKRQKEKKILNKYKLNKFTMDVN